MNAVSKDLMSAYKRDGFVKVEGFLGKSEITKLRDPYMDIMSGRTFHPKWKRGGINRFQHLSFLSYFITEKATIGIFERALEFAQDFAGEEMFVWADMGIMKPAGSEVPVAWHQDSAYWCYYKANSLGKNEPALTCWIAVTSVEKNMGPLSFIPRSHLKEITHKMVESATNDYNLTDRLYVDPSQIHSLMDTVQCIELESGDCTFHDSWTLHGSGANLGSRPRCGYALHFWPKRGRDPEHRTRDVKKGLNRFAVVKRAAWWLKTLA